MTIGSDATLVDYAKSLDCIHCGLCLTTCPTYKLTGVEASSPRGRIHMMRAVAEERLEADAEFADEMDFCLLCRHCESVCPAGVRFGSMMEHVRGTLEERRPHGMLARALRWFGFRALLPHRASLRGFTVLARLGQVTGLDALASPVLGKAGVTRADLPRIPRGAERQLLPKRTSARGDRRVAVALLEGCVMPELFGRVNHATVAVLSALGAEVIVPPQPACCGSLHAHNGDLEGTRALARRTVEAFEACADGAPLAVVTNSAGCGSHLRELHHVLEEGDSLHARAEALAGRARDFSQVAAELLATGDARPSLPAGALPLPATWDDPCHLCHGQQVRDEPRAVMAAIEGLELVEMDDPEACCGSAGIYSLVRADDSRAVLDPKLDALERCGARTLITANPGCHLQWESGIRRRGLDVRVVHLAEVLALSLGPQ